MPTATIVGILSGISTGLLAIGGSAMVLSLGAAGLCTIFSWLDQHIGGFVKRVFTSVLMGGAMMAGSGGFGLWMVGQFGLSAGTPAAAGGIIHLAALSSLLSLIG
jgi:hypothetical protein